MEKVAATVLLLASLQYLVCKCSREEYWVRPTQSDIICPQKNGMNIITLSDIVENPSRYFRSNTIIHFCPGTHTTNQTTRTPIQPANNTNELVLTGGAESARIIVDCGWNMSFAFQDVTNLTLSGMTFINCGLEIPNDWLGKHVSQWQHIQSGTHAALFLRNTSYVLRNVHILRSNGYGLLGINTIGTSVIIGCSFQYNYWKIGRSPTKRDQQTLPGGNTFFLLSGVRAKVGVTITISHTEFAHGIEREVQGIKASAGGLGFYLSSRSLTLARVSLLNCTFNNNTASNGGNLIFVTGNHPLPNVHLHIDSCRFRNGESKSGGGMYLAIDPYTEVSISNAIFDNNAANQAGGATYMTISVKQKALSLRIILQAMQQQKGLQ